MEIKKVESAAGINKVDVKANERCHD